MAWNPKKTFEEMKADPLRAFGAVTTGGLTEVPTAFGQKDIKTQAIGATGLKMGPPGGATPKLAQQPNTYAAAAGQMTPLQQQLAQQLSGLYGTGAGAMTGLIGQLQQQTQGDFGPGGSLAQQVLQQGLSKNLGDVRTQLASQRGLSPALAASIAATKQAELGGQTTQQAGILGLQQQLEAQKQLGGLASGAATLGSEGATRIGGQLSQADIESKRIQAGIAQANQAAQAADKARTVGLATSILGGGAQLGGALASGGASAALTAPPAQQSYAGPSTYGPGGTSQYAAYAYNGGRIDGQAPYAGDTPKNDVVNAKLSPGEIVIPRSAAGSKKAAKSFIESLDDWDEEPSYSKVLKARQKKNYSDGGQVGFPMSGPYAPVTQEKLDAATDRPLPAAQRLKTNIDDFLTGNVVEPLAQRGYPNLGAALATVPSVAAEMMIPSTTGELQGAVIPMPGLKKGIKKVTEAMKAEGAEKFIEGMARMNDDVDIDRLNPELYKKYAKDIEKAKKAKVAEEVLNEGLKIKPESFKESRKALSQIAGGTVSSPRGHTDLLAELNTDIPEVKKAFDNLKLLQFGEHPNPTRVRNQLRYNAIDKAYAELSQALAKNKDKLKLTPEFEEAMIQSVRRLPTGKGL
jgi:hypothetical protein